jgi:hypothetical protein
VEFFGTGRIEFAAPHPSITYAQDDGQRRQPRAAVAVGNTVMRLTPPRLALRSMVRYADWGPPPLA